MGSEETVTLAVRYMIEEEMWADLDKTNAVLMATVKAWSPVGGMVVLNGFGPELPVPKHLNQTIDIDSMALGMNVLIKVAWSGQRNRHVVQQCSASDTANLTLLNRSTGFGKHVREFARGIQRRMEIGSSEI